LLTHGTSYLGIGSKMFNAEDLANRNVDGLAASMQAFVDIKYAL
ncbi:MAG TPA: 2-dehydro-3-deoxyphosphogluconate aldolase, partial [Lactobacillus sp.]|nr:2-dehydro-3-deoxyphosphogluconate aldolase [Lactobacillus sp.]